MTTPRTNRIDDAAIGAALTWHATLQDSETRVAGWADFTAWLEADPAHGLAFSRVEDMHAALEGGAPELLRLLSPAPAPPLPGTRMRIHRPSWLAGGAVAGCAALIALLVWHRMPAPGSEAAVVEALPGHVRSVMLGDGTRIDLSGGSRIAYRLDHLSRRIVLDRGEAAITVGKDRRPLTLRAADLRVRDIGTVFDVALQASRVTVTVVTGLVAVSAVGQDQGTRRGEGQDPEADHEGVAVNLAAGQQLVHVRGGQAGQIGATDPQAVLSWRIGFRTYRDALVSDIVADLDRNFAVHVMVADAATGARRFSGVLKVDTMDATLNRLAALLNLTVVRRGDAVELTGPSPHP